MFVLHSQRKYFAAFQAGLIQYHWFHQQEYTAPLSCWSTNSWQGYWALWIFYGDTELSFQLMLEGNVICMFISQSDRQFSVISHLNWLYLFSLVDFVPLHIVWSVPVHANMLLLHSFLWISRVYFNKVSAICLQGKQHFYYIFPSIWLISCWICKTNFFSFLASVKTVHGFLKKHRNPGSSLLT